METTNNTTSLVVIKASDYGLEESKAQQIAAQFQPMLDKMVELEKEYNEVLQMPIGEKDTTAKAKEVRLKYVKVRTGTETIHKQQKAFYLAGGRYVDGWKNAQLFASQGIEEKLEQIEKYAEIKEKERIASLQVLRDNELALYGVAIGTFKSLGEMPEEVYTSFLAGTKTNYESKIEAERKAAEEKIAREKAEAEERERIRIENERLKKEAEEREKALQKERAKVEAEKRTAELMAKKEREAIEAKLKKEREEREKAERELKAKAEAEAKAKREEEERKQAEIKAKEEAERKAKAAPDKLKLKSYCDSLEAVTCTDLVSDEAKQILSQAKILVSKIKLYVTENADKL